MSTIPPYLDVTAHDHAGFVSASGLLVLQRRAFTPNREAVVGGRASVTLHPPRSTVPWWTITTSDVGGSGEHIAKTESDALSAAARFASTVVGTDLQPAPFTAAYMYGRYVPGPHGSDGDLIVSPLLYQPATDTVRTATNICVAHFPDGEFASATTYDDPAGRPAWAHVERALAVGFPSCDRSRGEDYCKRRLAWLAGALWLDTGPHPLRCAVLNLDMTVRH